jgi:hypothetical protein
MNVSGVPDDILSRKAIEARQRFIEAKKRRIYRQSFGPRAGDLLWNISQITPVRKVGSALVHAGLFKKFKRTKNELFGSVSWS